MSLVMALCLAAVLLSGCAQKGGQTHGLNPSEPTTVNIWHYYNGVQQEHFDKLILEFNESVGREMGIVAVGHNKTSVNDLAEAALAALGGDANAQEAPDMFSAYAGTAYTADKMGKLVDLSQYFTEEELDGYVEGYLEEGDLDGSGELKIFPTAKSTEVMMINATDWQPFADATGVSLRDLTTWEGLAQVAEQYYTYTGGKAFFGRDSVANYMVIGAKQLGLEYCTVEDGKLVMHEDKETVRRLWEGYYCPYVKGYYFSGGSYRSDDAQAGDIIAMVCSTPGSTYFPTTVTVDDERSYPIEELALSVPNFEDTDPCVVQQGAGMVVVKSEEKREYACTVFLKWFTEKERSIAFSANSGYLPVMKEANDFGAIAESLAENDSFTLLDAMEVAVDEVDTYDSDR